VEQLRKDIK
jgi:hypothetical protein